VNSPIDDDFFSALFQLDGRTSDTYPKAEKNNSAVSNSNVNMSELVTDDILSREFAMEGVITPEGDNDSISSAFEFESSRMSDVDRDATKDKLAQSNAEISATDSETEDSYQPFSRERNVGLFDPKLANKLKGRGKPIAKPP